MSQIALPSPQQLEGFLDGLIPSGRSRRDRPRRSLKIWMVRPFEDHGFFRRHVVFTASADVWPIRGGGMGHHPSISSGLFAWDGVGFHYLSGRICTPWRTRQVRPDGWEALESVLRGEGRPLSDADPDRLAALVTEGPLSPLHVIRAIGGRVQPTSFAWSTFLDHAAFIRYHDRIVLPRVTGDEDGGWTLEFTGQKESTLRAYRVRLPRTGSLEHSSRVIARRIWHVDPKTIFNICGLLAL